MEGFFPEAAVPNGPAMDAALFTKYDVKYVGSPLSAGKSFGGHPPYFRS